ncbi:MAG TPA: iron-sulfur cluster assembly scaffold protein [Dokdonella sp.]|uniref:iron-sulfur cluster assembly scaffold protein n=1 Tax=Dokdonella sp. TaxID=2291710 RepID=UPI002D7ED709|nr:iron-sulfur cluster assembly scaffold protein [Dokdonella sp.]HET9031435.1 iron-sulfur cluster assembly scaffold protein [Dokdonella sp.]
MMNRDVSADLAALYPMLKQYSSEVRKDRRLSVPPADSVTVHSPECGSQLTLDARTEGARVCEIGYRVRACSLGQASTAIFARHALNLDLATLRRLEEQVQAILDGSATHCDWEEMEIFTLIKGVPSRHGSILLPFQAMRKLFNRAGQTLPDAMENPLR